MKMNLERTNIFQSDGQFLDARHGKSSVSPNQKTRTIQSVDRALIILEIIANKSNGMTVTQVSEAVGLNISTCHHLLSTLVQRGYVSHLGRAQGYGLGPKLSELIEVSGQQEDPEFLLATDLHNLSERLGHGVQFAILSGNALMTKLSVSDPKAQINEPSEVKKMHALHATATGKAILAWIPDTELARIISINGLESYTEKTLTTLSGLIEELLLVRRFKYAIDDEEFCKGVVCIGATIREGAGAVIGSISVTMPSDLATDFYRNKIIKEVIDASNLFSNRLRKQSVNHF